MLPFFYWIKMIIRVNNKLIKLSRSEKMENTIVKELNAFLKGQFMGIHGYERLIHNSDNTNLKETLQQIQQDHKLHAIMVAERIQNLGGVPVDDVGIMGTMAEVKSILQREKHDTQAIIKQAKASEDKGIQMSEEIVKGDLDPNSRQLIQDILDTDRKHVERLNNMLH
jgi:bacterioferritin